MPYVQSTLLQLRTLLRQRLNEGTAVAWVDADLNAWLNEAARYVATETLCIEASLTFAAVAGTQTYTPTAFNDCIQVNRVEYVPTGQTTSYPIEYADFNNLDAVWWTAQTQTQSTPSYFTMWGMYPALKMVFYPTPAIAGTFTVYYWRLPAAMVADSDPLELPMGWHDLVVEYAFYLSLLRDRDSRWQQPLAMFQDRLKRLTVVSDRHTPHAGAIDTYEGGSGPSWLTGSGYW